MGVLKTGSDLEWQRPNGTLLYLQLCKVIKGI